VLHLLFEGNQNKQIARAMAISENTVRNHVRSIFQKLDSHTRTEAIATALRLGLVRVRGD
jgi:LuxR family maltose regulon positive regulatory protein